MKRAALVFALTILTDEVDAAHENEAVRPRTPVYRAAGTPVHGASSGKAAHLIAKDGYQRSVTPFHGTAHADTPVSGTFSGNAETKGHTNSMSLLRSFSQGHPGASKSIKEPSIDGHLHIRHGSPLPHQELSSHEERLREAIARRQIFEDEQATRDGAVVAPLVPRQTSST